MTGHLVGRSAEMSAVRARLLASGADPAALLVLGEAGIGKTALVEQAASEARAAGFTVLRARPVAAEGRLSYSGLIDLLSEIPRTRFAELPAPQLRALEVALKQRDPGQSSRDPLAVSMSLLSLLRQITEDSPVLVVVDDLQWLDRATERALGYALRRECGALRLLLAARDEARPKLFDEIIQELPGKEVEEIHLGPLSSAALHQIFKEELDVNLARPLLVKVDQASGGNPFFALEIASAIATGRIKVEPGRPLAVPTDLGALVGGRLALQSHAARQLLLLMAAAGEIEVAVARKLLGDETRDAMREATDAKVIEEADGRLRFTHPLLASSVYGAADRSELRKVHAALATASDDIERRAVHVALSGTEPEGGREHLLEEAGAHAISRGAPEVAVELLQLALDRTSVPPASLHRTLADALLRAGDARAAEEVLEGLVATLPPGLERARALALSATVAYETSSAARCVALCKQGLREAGDDPALRAHLFATLAAVSWDDLAKQAEYAAQAIELLDEIEDPDADSLCLALLSAAGSASMAGRGLNHELIERAIALEPESSLRVSDRPSAAYGALLKYDDDYEGARLWLDRTKQSIEAEGDEGGIPYILSHYPQLELWTGNLETARAVALEHLAFAERTNQEAQRTQALFNLSLADAHLGNIDNALSGAKQALEFGERKDDVYLIGLACWALGTAYIHGGTPAEARPSLDRAAELRERIGFKDPGRWRFYAEHVEALLATNDVDRAQAEAGSLFDRSARVDRVSGLATGHRSLALVAASRGALDEATAHLTRAQEQHQRWDNPFERARTLLTVGQVARRRKAKSDAKSALEAARSVFEKLGARLWADRATIELSRLGLRPAAPLELTETERRVAELAASGLTNKDVAASLFISPKTVEANLAKVYRKLGIRSRAELGARLGSGQIR